MTDLFNVLTEVTCGQGPNGPLVTVDSALPQAISSLVSIAKVVIPILVVVFGLLDLGKAVMSQKEDEIKKNQGLLVKRLIIAVLVFFVVSLVQFLVSLVGGNQESGWACFDCFINNKCSGK